MLSVDNQWYRIIEFLDPSRVSELGGLPALRQDLIHSITWPTPGNPGTRDSGRRMTRPPTPVVFAVVDEPQF